MNLKVMTPYSVVLNTPVSQVTVEAVDGFFTLKPKHMDFVNALKAGILTYKKEGKELFEKLNIDQFVKRKFQMMSGESTLVSLQFTASLLDTVLDRFGTKGVNYRKIDDHHFTVQTYVEVSDQFFAWLCGFGRRVKIIAPDTLKEQYKTHLDNIGKLYEKTEA